MIARMSAFLQETKVQIASIILAALYITTLLFFTYKKPIFSEEIVRLEEPSQIAKSTANQVDVGVHFYGFPNFSIKDSKFTLDGILWFRFDKGVESFETLEPFSIKNMVIENHDGKPFYKSQPIVKIIDEKVVVSYHVQVSFMADIDFKRFPIGGHRLNILFENRTVTPRELLFTINPENITFAEQLFIDNWQPVAVHTSAGVVRAKINNDSKAETQIAYPSFNISIDFKNLGARGLISLYFPLFILFFIGLLSLTIGIFDTARLGIIGSSLPTLVLFRFVIDAVSPNIGYTTHIDFIYYILVALSFLILFFQTYVVLFSDRTKEKSKATQQYMKCCLESLNSTLFMSILGILIIVMTYDFFR